MPTLEQYYGENTSDVRFVPGTGYMTTAQIKEQESAEKQRRQLIRAEAAAAEAARQQATQPQTAIPPVQPTITKVPVPGALSEHVPVVNTGPLDPLQNLPEQSQAAPPPWWIDQAYSNPNAQQAFANAANAVLPSLSPEDQRNLANYLAVNYKDVFGDYANRDFAPIPTKLTNERQVYFDPARANATLNLLNKVQEAAGGETGKGYDFLRIALNLINKYSTAGQPMTREQYNIFSNAVKDLVTGAGDNVPAYSNLAQLFNMPGFTAGQPFSNAPIPRLNE